MGYLESKHSQLSSLSEKNREYQSHLQEILAKLVTERDHYNTQIQKKCEEKRIKTAKKFYDTSPFIEFYNYDSTNQAKPRTLCLLRLLGGDDRKTKLQQMQDMVSVSSETSSEGDSDSSNSEDNSKYSRAHENKNSSNNFYDFGEIMQLPDFEDFEDDSGNEMTPIKPCPGVNKIQSLNEKVNTNSDQNALNQDIVDYESYDYDEKKDKNMSPCEGISSCEYPHVPEQVDPSKISQDEINVETKPEKYLFLLDQISLLGFFSEAILTSFLTAFFGAKLAPNFFNFLISD